jgi:hypothetical protein
MVRTEMEKNEKIVRSNVLELWAKKFPEVERWLGHVQKKEDNAYNLYRFCNYVGKSPIELLALKDSPASKDAEKLLDDFCRGDILGFTNSQQYVTSISVKSFFRWSYVDLAKASGIVNLQKVKPYHALTKEKLRKLWVWALNPRDKSLITFVNSTAIAKETLLHLTWGHLEENWENKELPCVNIGSEFLKGHGKGKYRDVRQVTFLTPESQRDLRNYKEWLESPQKLGRKLTPQDKIWLETCQPYRPVAYDTLGKLITTLSQNANVPFSWHDARRWVNTALEGISISPNWARKIRGRKVKGEEAPYSQPAIEQLRAKFAEAVPLLQFTSEASTTLESRVKDLEKLTASLTPEQQELIKKTGIQLRQTKTLSKEKRARLEKERCENGHCQRIVSEKDLSKFLAEGYEVKAVLPSGSIVVDR